MSRAPALLQPVYNTYRVFPKISNFQQFYFKICTFLQKYCYALNKILAVSGSEKSQTLYWKCVCTIRNRLEARCFVTAKELPALEPNIMFEETFLRFNRLFKSFNIYIVNFEKRPTWIQRFIQHRLMPFYQSQCCSHIYQLICPSKPLHISYFVQGPMLFFPSPFPSLSVTGRALSDQTGSFSFVPKNELHAS